MRKIPCLFKRDFSVAPPKLLNQVNDGCEWVLRDEGTATRKWDGTPIRILNGKAFKRFDCKKGKTPPPNFEPCCEPDAVTGHWPGWIPIENFPDDKWMMEAIGNSQPSDDGTYEAIGPKIGGNHEKADRHVLHKHGDVVLSLPARTFEGLRQYLHDNVIEGVVFHHPDGRMAKIRRDDYSFEWPGTAQEE